MERTGLFLGRLSVATNPEDPTLQQVIQDAIKTGFLDLHTSLPARIETYDPTTQKANIQILLKKKYKGVDGKEANLPVITNVPVQWVSASGGSAYITLPLKKGDIGIALFSERSLDKYLSGTGGIISPDDPRTHDLSDAFFIPGAKPFPIALTNVNNNDIIIQNNKTRIELSPEGKLSITGAGGQELITILETLITDLINARVVTALGASPFTVDSISKFTTDLTNIQELKK